MAGIALIGMSVALLEASEPPELRQIDLTVLSEEPDGRCEVRWRDPYAERDREGAYRCDTDRHALLKAPDYDPQTGFGWDSGWVLAEGDRKGELYSLDEYDDTGANIGAYALGLGLVVTYLGLRSAGVRLRLRRRPGGGAPAEG
ncbi:hypothetical protein [Streptomyces sp. AP-93]|uniref:hypothetical protein n=1 Tax=Streptomyces sp. AP-93 TaxID=2929048 RepID=UPI001FB01A76|nr:hypothetical protein [Streptomyces sp. AP-93]MCJ0874100.1 hypothetical protein [Streptomyces sp. AP-93]